MVSIFDVGFYEAGHFVWFVLIGQLWKCEKSFKRLLFGGIELLLARRANLWIFLSISFAE